MLSSLPKPIAVIGLGITGRSVLRLLLACGVPSYDIVTFDSKDSTAKYNNPKDLIELAKPKSLIVSPGVPLQLDWIKAFKSSGGVITSELAIAFSHIKNEKVLAVTGSVGKSTTVALLEAGLKSFSSRYFVGGNYGVPLADYAADVLLGSRSAADWVVLELSSFQLENFSNLRCDWSAITSLLPNHMERYSSLEEYYQTKWALVARTKYQCLLNESGGDLASYYKKAAASNCLLISPRAENLQHFNLRTSRLIGEHNIDNLALAASLGLRAGWPEAAVQGMLLFSGLPHRLENCGTFSDRQFINDSKATTIDSVLTAVKTVSAETSSGKLWVLLGGRDKNLPWQNLAALSGKSQLRFCFFGEVAPHAKSLSALDGVVYPNLKSALDNIFKISAPGDTVLLSPGGSSYDEFKNFEDRGNYFKETLAKH